MEPSPLLAGSEEGLVLLLGPGSWPPRSFSRKVFWGEASPEGGGGRKDASRRFRATLPPAPLQGDQGRVSGALKGKAAGLAGEVGSRQCGGGKQGQRCSIIINEGETVEQRAG